MIIQAWVGYNIQLSGLRCFLTPNDVHRKIFFIRHAEYYRQNDNSELIGSLTPKGKVQAHKTGLYLTRANIKPTVLFYSDVLRARQTAGIITTHFPDSLQTFALPLLREVSYGIVNDNVTFRVSLCLI